MLQTIGNGRSNGLACGSKFRGMGIEIGIRLNLFLLAMVKLATNQVVIPSQKVWGRVAPACGQVSQNLPIAILTPTRSAVPRWIPTYPWIALATGMVGKDRT